MGKVDWSEEKVRVAVQESVNYSECVRKLGVSTVRGNKKTLKKYINRYNIDISHFTFLPREENRHIPDPKNKIPLEDILTEHSTYNSTRLKSRLIQEGLLTNECQKCGLPPEWDGENLVLQLDHINGVNNDNRLENLRLLCPNCHSQTDTFTNRDGGNKCDECGSPCTPNAKHCRDCFDPSENLKWEKEFDPDPDELKRLVWKMPAGEVGDRFGVSGRAVKKRCRKHGIDTPGRGYWQKKRAGKI